MCVRECECKREGGGGRFVTRREREKESVYAARGGIENEFCTGLDKGESVCGADEEKKKK